MKFITKKASAEEAEPEPEIAFSLKQDGNSVKVLAKTSDGHTWMLFTFSPNQEVFRHRHVDPSCGLRLNKLGQVRIADE